MNAHVDVAAYALGALSDRESSQFEDHLVQCAACASELESMVSVVTWLADVRLEDITGEAPPVMGPYTAGGGIPAVGYPQAGPPLTPPVGPVGPPAGPTTPAPLPFGDPVAMPVEPRREDPRVRRDDRRDDPRDPRDPRGDDRRAAASPVPPQPTPISHGRSKRRRRGGVVLLAAAAAIVGVVAGGAAVVETGFLVDQQNQAATNDAEAAPSLTGDTVSATDKKTGAHVDAALESRPWGTRVSFSVTKIEGPKSCRLIAVRKNGDTEVLSTWTVPEGGYGYEPRPQPLSLQAATALRSKDIAQLKVQAMDENGDPATLVTVRV
jgi:anti-sigma factor RsiW